MSYIERFNRKDICNWDQLILLKFLEWLGKGLLLRACLYDTAITSPYTSIMIKWIHSQLT